MQPQTEHEAPRNAEDRGASRVVEAGPLRGAGRRVRRALAALGALLLASACAHSPVKLQAMTAAGQGMTARIETAGLTRIQVARDRQSPPWDTVSLLNAAAAPLQGIQLWDAGRSSLLTTAGGKTRTTDLYAPFALLPGEVLALTAPATADQLTGLLSWETPREPARLKGSLARIQRAECREDGSIVLTPGKSAAWVQLELSAPLTFTSARIAWEAEPAPSEPYLMLSLDGDTWIRVGRRPEQPRVDWQHPLDLSERVAGIRRFFIRVAYEVPATGSHEPGGARAPEALRLRRLRVDREVQGPGRLRKWGAGINEFDVTIKSPAQPELELRLSGGK